MRSRSRSLLLPALAALCYAATAATAGPTTEPVGAPKVAEFGATVSAMQTALASHCSQIETRELDIAKLPVAKHSHTQIDCHGLQHAGGERLAEFVFADDALVFVWVLTNAEEEDALLKALNQHYGPPSHDLDAVVAFTDHRLALRRDKAELLYYGEAVAELYSGWFDSMGEGGQ